MALSGSFSGSIVSGHYKVQVDWVASQDIANNRTTITCNLYFINDWRIDIGARTNSVTIAGTSYSIGSPAYSTEGTHHIGSCSKVIDHNPDGSLGNIDISAVFNIKATISGTYYASISASDKVYIDTIPRASVPTLSSQNFTVGDNVYLYTNRKSSAFTHSLFFQHNDGSYHGHVAAGITESINISDYTSITDLLYSQSADKKERSGRFLLRTFNGDKIIGDNVIDFKANIPENSSTKPTVTMKISPTELESWVKTDYVQGKSQVIAEITASPKLYAGIKSYSISVDGKTISLTTSSESAAVTSQILNHSGPFTVVGKSIDTRGISSNEESTDITVIPYGKPYITHNSQYGNIVCARFDEEKGAVDDSGTSIKLIVGAKWYSLSEKENTATLEVRCVSGTTDSGWIPIEATEQGGGIEDNYISYYDINTIIPSVTVAVDKTYSVYIRCTDKFGECNSDSDKPYFKIPTEDVCFHLGKFGKRAAFGKYAEHDKTVEIASDWKLMLEGETIDDFITERGTTTCAGVNWVYKKFINGDIECKAIVYMGSGCVAIESFSSPASYKMLPLPFEFAEMPNISLTSISTAIATGYGVISYSVRDYKSTSFNIQQNCLANLENTWVSVSIYGKLKQQEEE